MWYSGGKLAPDLTLPKLRHRWNSQAAGPAGGPAAPLTPAERAAIWDHVTRTAAAATEQIRQLSVTDPGLAADAAWAAADTFHAAASALGSRAPASGCAGTWPRLRPRGRLPPVHSRPGSRPRSRLRLSPTCSLDWIGSASRRRPSRAGGGGGTRWWEVDPVRYALDGPKAF